MSGEDRHLGPVEILELLTSITNDPALAEGPPRSLMIVGGSYPSEERDPYLGTFIHERAIATGVDLADAANHDLRDDFRRS